jgi:single-stranded DNA-binding protein
MLQTFTIATNEYRGGNNERTKYHPCVAWDRLADSELGDVDSEED